MFVRGLRTRVPRVLLVAGLLAGISGMLVSGVQARQAPAPAGAVEVLSLRPNVYMVAGAGANIAVAVGSAGLIVVDAGSAVTAPRALEAINGIAQRHRTSTPQGGVVVPRIRYVFNTSAHPDHVGGNAVLAKAGLTIFGGGAGTGIASATANGGAAAIVAHDNVTQRMGDADFPVESWPTEGYTGRNRSYYLSDEGIQLLHQPAAHADGDSIVVFRRADVIVTGEIFDVNRVPIIDVDKGGSITGVIAALNAAVDLAIPAVPLPWMEGRTLIVPARGRIADQADLVEYRDMVTYVRDVVADLIKKGMTLEQVQKADPLLPLRPRYGAETGPWTTTMFIEAVYKGLAGKS